MPKKNQLLKYLRLDRLGRLTYQRHIPLALRPYLGNKATIRRSLGVEGTDCGSTQVLTAYAQVHGQIQGAIDAAEAQHQHKSTAIQAQPQSFALSPRDVAGIAANPLLEMRNALADGRISTPIQADLQQKAIAIDYGERSTSKQMTEAEWRELHGLRKDGKGLKPGPSKRKPKSAFDMELVPGEPIDFEELELQWMEEQILRKKNEPHQLKGKRLRADVDNAVTPRAEEKLFWY